MEKLAPNDQQANLQLEESKIKKLLTGPFGKWALGAGAVGAGIFIARGIYLSHKTSREQRTTLINTARNMVNSNGKVASVYEFGDAIRETVGENVSLKTIDRIIKEVEKDEDVKILFMAYRESVKKSTKIKPLK